MNSPKNVLVTIDPEGKQMLSFIDKNKTILSSGRKEDRYGDYNNDVD